MKRRKKKINTLKVLLVFSVFALATVLFLVKMNHYSLELSISDGENIYLEYGIDYEVPEVTAIYKGSIFNRAGRPVDVEMEGEVDFQKLGEYQVTYTARYKKNTVSATETVVIKDSIPPVIALRSNENVFTSPGKSYMEEGFSAVDNYNGDITKQVVRQEQDGVVTYSVSDSSGNETTVTRTIVYKEEQPAEPSGEATGENVSGDKQQDVSSGEGQQATLSGEGSEENITEIPNDKVIYLTFDDGPGKYTEKLLNILDKYGVKVTFFVTNQHEEYQDLIGQAYERGHTIALHSYSHDYSKIYESKQAYYADLKQMSDICLEQTGVRPVIVRFPGGSSNTVSRKYKEGIMSSLTKDLSSKGYLYCDWNVASLDVDGATTADEVAANVILGVQERPVSVVLQHDTREFSVDAVEQIICWGFANGYTFLPLTEDSKMVHHKVNN